MYTDDNGIVRFEALDNIAPLQVNLNAALESVSDSLTDTNERIDVLEEDTGWVTLPITDTSNFELYTTGAPILARKRDNTVSLRGVVRCTTANYVTGTTYRTFAQLPSGFEPSGIPAIEVMQGSNDNRWALTVNTVGAVQAARYGPGTHSASVWLPFSMTYLI